MPDTTNAVIAGAQNARRVERPQRTKQSRAPNAEREIARARLCGARREYRPGRLWPSRIPSA
jgi:hypothetical protein